VILTSIEYDHADIYQDFEAVKRAFRQLLALIPKQGILIANADDAVVREMASDSRSRVEIYGKEGRWSASVTRVTPQGTVFQLQRAGETLGELEIPLWAITT